MIPLASRLFWLVLVAAASGSATSASALQAPRPEKCIECHLEQREDRLSAPARNFQNDVHSAKGFGCLDCHGSATGHEAAAGFLSQPSRREIPRLCGRCHSDAAFMRRFNPSLRVDQVTEYWTSRHGQRLRESGDPDVATCIDCHGVHGILPLSDPASPVYALNVANTCGNCHADEQRMAGHNVPTDQLDEYRSSVHGRLMFEQEDLSAPVCNDCHGNHGAVPPGIISIRNVCGQCHTIMADFFAESRHVERFDADGLPGCETCHGNHAIAEASDENLALRSADVCERCHAANDTVGGDFLVIKRMIDSLGTELERSRNLLLEAANAGMEVSQAQFELEEVNNKLTMARSAVHTFHVQPVKTNIDQGLELTAAGLNRARQALDEHRFRRIGLACSAVIILALIGGIILKIRQLERSGLQPAGTKPTLEEPRV